MDRSPLTLTLFNSGRMWPRSPKPLLLISFFIQVIPSTSNTEIINLSPSLGPRTPAFDAISSNWPVLTPLDGKNERRWTMSHIPREGDAGGCMEKGEWCEDDLWLVLECDAEEWKRHRGFTLRISWPASVRSHRLSVCRFSWVGYLKTARLLTLRKPTLTRGGVPFLNTASV